MSLQVEEVRISLPHIELAAHLFGPPDGKPVIALHGWLDNAMSFSRLAPKLAGLRIVALDFAGHGHSAHRAEGASYLLWDYALDVLMVAEQLGWERFFPVGALDGRHRLGAARRGLARAHRAAGVDRWPDSLHWRSRQGAAEARRSAEGATGATPQAQAGLCRAGKAVEARMRGVGRSPGRPPNCSPSAAWNRCPVAIPGAPTRA